MSSMISITTTGSFDNTNRALAKMSAMEISSLLNDFGQQGVAALASATPERSGLTASSWSCDVTGGGGDWTISWYNSNTHEGVPIAVLIQYGHGTGTGGYVQGRDFINPALRPIFDQIADAAWKAVTST